METTIQIDGRPYQMASDDIHLSQMGADFESHMVSLFRRFVSQTDTVADVGANIGLTSILFSSIANRVVCFEPSPSTFEILTQNIHHNNLDNVTPINIGLGDENKTTTITFSPSNRSGGFVSDKLTLTAGYVTEQIRLARMDDIWDFDVPCNFIRMDVEGFEGNVIRGAANLLSTFKPTVVLKLNHWCLNVFRRVCVQDFFDLLCTVFPVLYAVDADRTTKNLHEPDEVYYVMHEHIVHSRFLNIVAGYDDSIRQRLS